jgi:hypothetical protein
VGATAGAVYARASAICKKDREHTRIPSRQITFVTNPVGFGAP